MLGFLLYSVAVTGALWRWPGALLRLNLLQLAQLQPKMELATEDARTSVQELRTETCAQQKKIHQQAEKLKVHSHVQQERLNRGQERMKIRLERQRHSFDI